jgi:hypothetical protein
MKSTISQENTLLRVELQLVGIIRSEICPASTSKDAKEIVIRWFFKDTKIGSISLNDMARHAID